MRIFPLGSDRMRVMELLEVRTSTWVFFLCCVFQISFWFAEGPERRPGGCELDCSVSVEFA